MHRDPSGQCIVLVGVAYDADVDQVVEIMLSSAKAHRLVQTFPGPGVSLADFGPKALEFQLACTVANVNDAWNVQSDLRLTILKRLQKAGIEMPAAQRDVRIREMEALTDLIAQQLKLKVGVATQAADEPAADEPVATEPLTGAGAAQPSA
jgi:small-conductance mechanosensitive channel